jgi:hypothetical protein
VEWHGFKTALEWVIVPALVVLMYVPWHTLINWVKQEVKKPSKEVI